MNSNSKWPEKAAAKVKGYIGEMPAPHRKISRKIHRVIRDRAIEQARVKIALSKNNIADYTQEQLEIIVREEEKIIRSDIRKSLIYAGLILVGINLWGG